MACACATSFILPTIPRGDLVGSLDNLDQGVSGLPAIRISQKENAVHFEIPALAGIFEGTYDGAKSTLSGSWSQTGVDQNLIFKRSDVPLEIRRPQTPAKPYPYLSEEVTFSNSAAKVTLAGTLTLPKGQGPFAAAILIAGSGPHDRDELIAGHKPFLVLGDYLTRKGIARVAL